MSQQTTTFTQGAGRKNNLGFTIVELAVVIAVIGILASIVALSYHGVQVRNATFVLQSDIKGAAVQLKADKTYTGLYPETAGDSDGARGLNASGGTSFEYTYVAAGNSYCLTAKSSRKGVPVYRVSSSDENPVEGVCPGHADPNNPNNPTDPGVIATTAEGCFRVSGNTITGYRSYEYGNSSNPACPLDVVFPTSIGGVQMTSVGSAAFREVGITSLVISSSITSIQSAAFRENNLTTVIVPNTVTSMGSAAFRQNRLTSVTISNSVTSLASEVFRENRITTVVIPNSVTSIGSEAFDYNRLTSVTIPGSVTSIASEAFRDNQLGSVSIPTGATIVSTAFDSGVVITRY